MSKRKREHRVKLVAVRVLPDQLVAWKEAAERSRLTLSEWIRIRCNGQPIDAVAPGKAA